MTPTWIESQCLHHLDVCTHRPPVTGHGDVIIVDNLSFGFNNSLSCCFNNTKENLRQAGVKILTLPVFLFASFFRL